MPPVLEHGILEELTERKREIILEANELLKYIYTNVRMRKTPKTFEELLSEYKTLRFAEGAEEVQLKGVPIDGSRHQDTVLQTTKKELREVFKRVSALFHLYKILELKKAV